MLDKIEAKIVQLVPKENRLEEPNVAYQYQAKLDEKFDLEEIAKEQGYKGPDREKMNELIRKMDIQTPLEDLLKMIGS